MNNFLWLIRRELWEHKAIWIAPLVLLGCFAVMVLFLRMHLGPDVVLNVSTLNDIPQEKLVRLVLIIFAGLTAVVFAVMGIISFFYAIDSLYSDRRDRSVLFWKSMPLSDAETVLSKFIVACVVIPLVALLAAVLAQFLVAGVAATKLALSGTAASALWQPQAIMGGIAVAALWCIAAIFWYAPVIGYLMLASAWAPKGPFLWAVLPPVALALAERLLFYTDYVSDFIGGRLFGIERLLDGHGGDRDPQTEAEVRAEVAKLSDLDLLQNLVDFFKSPELWFGVLAAALLLAAAMWVRRYRDETA